MNKNHRMLGLSFFMILGVLSAGCAMPLDEVDEAPPIDMDQPYETLDGPTGSGNGLTQFDGDAAICYVNSTQQLADMDPNQSNLAHLRSWTWGNNCLYNLDANGNPVSHKPTLPYLIKIVGGDGKTITDGTNQWSGQQHLLSVDETLAPASTALKYVVLQRLMAHVNSSTTPVDILSFDENGRKNVSGDLYFPAPVTYPAPLESLRFNGSGYGNYVPELGIHVEAISGGEVIATVWVSSSVASYIATHTTAPLEYVIEKRLCGPNPGLCKISMRGGPFGMSGQCTIASGTTHDQAWCDPGYGIPRKVTTTMIDVSAIPTIYDPLLP